MSRSPSPLNSRNISASKRYVSPNERQNTQENDQQKIQQLLGQQVNSKIMHIDQSEIASNAGNSSKISNLTQFANYMFVPCPTHPDLFITNLCQHPSCIEPLCPECITSHLEMHQKNGSIPKIENIQRVRKEFTYKIDEISKEQQFKLQDTKKYFQDAPQKQYQETINELRQVHEQITNIIDDYFESLYKQLKQQNSDQFIQNLGNIEKEIIQNMSQLIKLQEELHNDSYVRAIIQIYDQKTTLFSNSQTLQLEKLIQDFKSQQYKIVFEKNNLELLNTYCKKLCYLITNQNYSVTNTTITKTDRPPLKPITQIELINTIKPQEFISEKLINEEKQSSFNTKNHFQDDKDQLIIRLEEGGYAAYIYDIKQNKYQVESINGSIKIPLFHRFITTNQGQHLIIGGVDREKSRFKAIPYVYEFNTQKLQLILHSEMVLPRAMTSACQIDNFIYVVGGTSSNDENNSMAKAERLDLTTRKWYTIEDPIFKVSGCALVAINNNQILKIGGKCDIFTPSNSIEMYEINTNKWVKIDFKFQSTGYLRLPFNSCAVHISYNQILIIGGSIHDVQSDETQIYNIKEQTLQKSKSLPNSLEFPTQTPIIQQNKVYILTENEIPLLIGNEEGFHYQ